MIALVAPDGSARQVADGLAFPNGMLVMPDSICADAENAVWYADVPNKRCVRVREGGQVLETIDLDRGCFACALGGTSGTTLFMLAQQWDGLQNMFKGPRSGLVLTAQAPAPRAGWP